MSVYELENGMVGELHVVGKPYLGERGPHPAGYEYNWYGDRHMLRLWIDAPTAAEIESVEAGDGEFALTVKPPIIFFLFRFAPSIPWNTCMYSWHLQPPEARLLPPALHKGADHPFLTTFLIDCRDNVLRALRTLTLSPAFGFELHAAIRDQAAARFDLAAYKDACQRADDPTVHPQVVTQRLLSRASVCCHGGD